MYVLLSRKNKAHTHPEKHDYILISLIINNFTFHFTQTMQECETFVAGEVRLFGLPAPKSQLPLLPLCWMSERPNVAFKTAQNADNGQNRWPN